MADWLTDYNFTLEWGGITADYMWQSARLQGNLTHSLSSHITSRRLIATAEIRPSCGRIQSICDAGRQASTRGTSRYYYYSSYTCTRTVQESIQFYGRNPSKARQRASQPDHKMQRGVGGGSAACSAAASEGEEKNSLEARTWMNVGC